MSSSNTTKWVLAVGDGRDYLALGLGDYLDLVEVLLGPPVSVEVREFYPARAIKGADTSMADRIFEIIESQGVAWPSLEELRQAVRPYHGANWMEVILGYRNPDLQICIAADDSSQWMVSGHEETAERIAREAWKRAVGSLTLVNVNPNGTATILED